MNNRIDSHQHFWIFDPIRDSWIDDSMKQIQRDFMPEDLAPLLSANKFQGCVAVQADQTEAQTDFLVELASKNDFIKGVVGWVDLRAENLRERLLHYSSQKIVKGFRHIVQGEADDFMLRADFRNGIAALKEFDYTYDILLFQRQLPAAIDLVQQFPEQAFVIDHIAKPDIKSGDIALWKKNMAEIAKASNVYCKVSGMVTEANWSSWTNATLKPYLDVVFENFATDKIMYGSDWPVCNVAADYSQVVHTLEEYISKLSTADQHKIWSENAARFYKLDL